MILPLFLLALLATVVTANEGISTSYGFKLRIGVPAKQKDLRNSVNNTYVTTVYVGQGRNVLQNTPSIKKGLTFYVNGTGNEPNRTYFDGASPLSPFGIELVPSLLEKYVRTAQVKLNAGRNGVYVDEDASLQPGNWLACDEALEFYEGKRATVIKQVYYEPYPTPKECIPVTLTALCVHLEALPENAHSSHKFAREVVCK